MIKEKNDPVLVPDEKDNLTDLEMLASIAGIAAMVAGLATLILSDCRTRIKIIKTDA
jgi:hypothetical protein